MLYLLKMKNRIYNKCKDALLNEPFEIRNGNILISCKHAQKVLREAIDYCFMVQKQPQNDFWDESVESYEEQR